MNWKNLTAAVAFLSLLIVSADRADARRFVRTATAMKSKQPAAAAAPAAKAAVAKTEAAKTEPAKVAAPAPTTACAPVCPPVAVCCPTPCIRYVDLSCGPVCCDSRPPVKTLLKVVNPQTCCAVDVPVCLPACCEGSPTVCARCGILLCRGAVTYDWCCGYRVVVRFDRCGDVTVVYRG